MTNTKICALFALCTMFGASNVFGYNYGSSGFSNPWYYQNSRRSTYYGVENGVEITDCSEELTGTVTLPSHVSNGLNVYPVIGVDLGYVSDGNTTLTDLVIGSGYRYIGSYSFDGYTALTHVTLNEGLDKIERCAFSECSSLQQITIPASVTGIGNGVFSGCSGLSSIIVNPDNQHYKSENGLLMNKTGTTLLAAVGSIKTLNLPTSVTTIAESTFYNDETLTGIDIPYHVKTIGEYAFAFCDASTLNISEGLTSIGENAFYFCNKIKRIKIPKTVTSIGELAFGGWGQRMFKVESGNLHYSVWNDVLMSIDNACIVAIPGGCQYVKLPTGITEVPGGLFDYSACTEVSLPDSVKNLSDNAFHGANITYIEIPNSVTNIGEDAFSFSTDLGCVVVGTGVVSLGEDAFYYTRGLTNLVFKGLPPTGLADADIQTSTTICYPSTYSTEWSAALASTKYKSKAYSSISEITPYRPTNKYRVWFDANEGSGIVYGCKFTTSTIENLPVIAMQRDGYDFAGWSRTSDGAVDFYEGEAVMNMTNTSPMTLYAVWEPSAYQVIFDANGGSGTMQSQQGVMGTVLTLNLNQFTRTGYRFGGWATEAGGAAVYADGERVNDLKPDAQGTVTLYAVWLANTCTLRFYANGGTGDMPDQVLTYDIPATISANQFVRDGYDFVGWATNNNDIAVWEDGQMLCNVSSVHDDIIDAYAVWKEGTILWPIISPTNGTVFLTATCEVSISCLSEGATIYYTTDGSTPRIIDACKYVQPFTISESTTIKAVCVKDTMKSPYITANITQQLTTLAEAVGAPDLTITSDSASPWIPVFDNTAIVGGISARSGKLVTPKRGTVESAMEVSVQGAGELSFWWKVDCEHDDSGDCTWDRLMYFKDGATEDEERIDGNSGWLYRTVTFSEEGTHTLKWVYLKDNYDDETFTCQDCGWVNAVVWTPQTPIPEITDVTAGQRYPWNGMVDICFCLSHAANVNRKLVVKAINTIDDTTNIAKHVSGDVEYTNGTHHIVWDMEADGLTVASTSMVFSVAYGSEIDDPRYCVIDLSDGASASSYQVTYLDSIPGSVWADEYKTTKIVLQRVESGTCVVSIDEPYYIGVFEITQEQYYRITGESPSYFSGDTKPVEQVSYDMIRGNNKGAQYPLSSDVDESSFLGKLRRRAGLQLDLPTESQWEYACRAGTTTEFSYGNSNSYEYMWFGANSVSSTHDVGTLKPNPWGLYDMHGNVQEWCLEWGPHVSGTRSVRGGCWQSPANWCGSSVHAEMLPNYGYKQYGFRIVETSVAKERACNGFSKPVPIDLTRGQRIAATSEVLTYSTLWDGVNDVGAVSIISIDDAIFYAGSNYGTVNWTPQRNGTYSLTHRVFNNSTQMGETLTATFVVSSFPTVQAGKSFEFIPTGSTKQFLVENDWVISNGIAKVGEDISVASVRMNRESGKFDIDGNPMYLWQDYVAGTDPTNLTSQLKAEVGFDNGKPMVTWKPDLGDKRIYKVWGRESLDADAGGWTYPTNALHHFFRVTVEMK